MFHGKSFWDIQKSENGSIQFAVYIQFDLCEWRSGGYEAMAHDLL